MPGVDDSYYINPLGQADFSIPYNNVNKLKKQINTINARINDNKLRQESYKTQLGLWTITISILILVLITILKNSN